LNYENKPIHILLEDVDGWCWRWWN